MSSQPSYDYIVAGGGSAGCALAARLAEDGTARVLLVEAGGNGRSFFSTMPAGNGFIFANPAYDWRYWSVPQPALGGRRIYYPRGRGLGGSSLMNGMIYTRGNAADYDRWSQKGALGWSYAEVLPYFKRSEGARHRAGDPYHGSDGPLALTPARNYGRADRAFVAAAIAAGATPNDDFNGARQEGVGRIDSKVYAGRRQSSARGYLAVRRKNLDVLTGSLVLGLVLERGRAVALRHAGGTVRAEREIILSLGAFGSPQCLMLSGIGPADHLRDHGIAVAHDLPGVGEGLFDHPNVPMQFAISDPALSLARFQRIDRALWMGLQYLVARAGPASGSFWSALLFHALRDRDMPELQIYCTPMIVREDSGKASGWTIQRLLSLGDSVIARGKTAAPGMQFDINLLRPASFGNVRLASSDPRDQPRIDPRFLSEPGDLADLVAGMRHMREVARQADLAEILGPELSPGPDATSDADLERAVRALLTTGHHPVATCRMGTGDDPGAVLDPALRVRGIEGLRVVDASAFPDQIGGNPNAPIIMMAERAADLILGRPPLPPEDPRPQTRKAATSREYAS